MELPAGFTFLTPTFVGVGEGGYSIQDIKLIDASGWGEEQIQILTDGDVTETYEWWCADNAGDEGEGWFIDGVKADRMISNGEGLLFFNDYDVEMVQFSGQVLADSKDIDIETGFNNVGNATPIEKSIQDFILAGASGWGEEQIQILTDGDVTETYEWWCEDNAGDEGEGWFIDGVKADRMILPGEAFLLFNDFDSEVVTIPAAL